VYIVAWLVLGSILSSVAASAKPDAIQASATSLFRLMSGSERTLTITTNLKSYRCFIGKKKPLAGPNALRREMSGGAAPPGKLWIEIGFGG